MILTTLKLSYLVTIYHLSTVSAREPTCANRIHKKTHRIPVLEMIPIKWDKKGKREDFNSTHMQKHLHRWPLVSSSSWEIRPERQQNNKTKYYSAIKRKEIGPFVEMADVPRDCHIEWSNLEKKITYSCIYVQSEKIGIDYLIYKTEIERHREQMYGCQGGRRVGWIGSLGLTYILLCIKYRITACIKSVTNEDRLCSTGNPVLCGDLNGKEIQERGAMCIYIADSLCHTIEANTTL